LVATFVQDASGKAGVPLPLMLAIGGFLVMTGLSILFSIDRGRSLELSASWIPGVLLFVVISERLRSAENLRSVYGCLSWVALGLAIVLLAGRWFYGPDAHGWLRDLGFPVLVVPNDCHFLALLTPFSLVLAHRNPRSGLGVVALLSIGATALAIIALGGRGAMLVWGACLVVTGTLLQPRLGVGLAIASVVVVGLGDAALGFPLASKFTSIVDTRISLWIVAWEMFLDAPWMGQGPHTYRLLYPEYLNRVEFPDWVRFDPWGTAVPWPHNIYLETLAERGVLGLLALSSLVGIALYYTVQARRGGGAEVALLASGAMGCLTGIFVAGIFEASFLRIWFVVLFFCVLGVVGRLAALTQSRP
jgi:O-antigen ligase